jgi:hypothetical protein
LDKIVQSANASRPSAVKMCVLLNKPRITRERYTPFGICLGDSMQVLANAQTCSLVSWVIGQRSLAKCDDLAPPWLNSITRPPPLRITAHTIAAAATMTPVSRA